MFKLRKWRSESAGSPAHGALLFVLLIFSVLSPAWSSRAASIVHDFYLPMPESQVRQTFIALESGVGTTLDTVYSVVVTGNGTVVYYDQWEDGYEIDLNHPTQPSTQV